MSRPVLTIEILKGLPFQLSLHLNGGSKYSKRISTNEEWDLGHVVETNGSPNYRITSDTLYMMSDSKVCHDLQDKGKPLQEFIDAYNQARALRTFMLPTALAFLDFDGVIHTWTGPEGKSLDFHPPAIESLLWLLEQSGAHIVISSSWREHFTLVELIAILHKQGVPAERILDTTPVPTERTGVIFNGRTRGQDIQDWLDQHPEHAGTPYVVIDDDPNIHPHEGRFVHTEFDLGLTPELARQALEILDGW